MAVRYKEHKNFGFLIERTIKKIRQNLQRRFVEAGLDITVDQWVILDQLNNRNGLSQNELAECTYKDAPTVTRIIDLLCKKGYTTRVMDTSDRRRFQIMLTEKGHEIIDKALPEVYTIRKIGWDGLTDSDYKNLMYILDKIYHNF